MHLSVLAEAPSSKDKRPPLRISGGITIGGGGTEKKNYKIKFRRNLHVDKICKKKIFRLM